MSVFLLLFILFQCSLARNILPTNKEIAFKYSSTVYGEKNTVDVLNCDGKAQTYTEWVTVSLTCMKSSLGREIDSSLSLPFAFKHVNGLVKELSFDRWDMPQSTNLKRAVVGLFDVNMELAVSGGYENQPSIEGDCAVQYSSVSEGNSSIVTKVLDIPSCSSLPETRYGLRYAVDYPSNSWNINVKTVYDYFLSDEVLKESHVYSVHSITAEEDKVLATTMRSSLTIGTVSPLDRRILFVQEQNSPEEIIFDNELAKQFERDASAKKNSSLFHRDAILDFLRANNNVATIRWSTLKKLVYSCSEEDLMSVAGKLYKDYSETEQYIFERGLASAGTIDSKDTLLCLYNSGKISSTRLAFLVKLKQEVDVPVHHVDRERLKIFMDSLATRGQVSFLQQSVKLANGELKRASFGKTLDITATLPARLYGGRDFALHQISHYKKFEASKSLDDKILHIKKFGNSGLKEFLPFLKSVINDQNQLFVVRLEAIYALRLIKDNYPQAVQKILLPVFLDSSKMPELRMSALIYFLHTIPKKHLLELIVANLNKEVDDQVAGFTLSTLQSLSKTTLPSLTHFRKDIALCLGQVERLSVKTEKSFFEHASNIDRKLKTGISLDHLRISERGSKHPIHEVYSWELMVAENWYQYFLQLGYTEVAPDELMVFMRYKQLDYGYLFMNRTSFENLVEQKRLDGFDEILEELKKHFSCGPDIKATVQMPTVLGIPITHSAKVSGLMASWFSLSDSKTLKAAIFTTLGYDEEKGGTVFSLNKTMEFSTDLYFTQSF